MKNAKAKSLPKREMRRIIKEEVDHLFQILLPGDRPFKDSRQGKKTYFCLNCNRPFHKKVWFQLYDSPSCGSSRRSRILRKWRKG